MKNCCCSSRLSYYLLIACLFLSSFVYSNPKSKKKNKELKYNFQFNRNDVEVSKKGEFDVVYMKDTEFSEDKPGEPWLPTVFKNIVVPRRAKNIEIELKALKEVKIADGLYVYPVQEPVITGGKGEFTPPNKAAYKKRKKKRLGYKRRVQGLRGVKMVPVRLNPLRLIPETGELFLAEEIEVTVKFKRSKKPRKRMSKRHRKHFKKILQKVAVNPALPDSDPLAFDSGRDSATSDGGVNPPKEMSDSVEECDYLVITNNDLIPAFDRLCEHRFNIDSYKTHVIDVEDIYSNYIGKDQQEKIRNCIKDFVNNHGTLYVVLGGDNSIVPDRNCISVVGKHKCSDIPTDLYYSGLDDNWDINKNGVYGEAEHDEGDFYPDVILGRIPVRTYVQTTDYIEKLINYETNPPKEILKKMIITGSQLWHRYTGDNRPTDTMSDEHMAFMSDSHPVVSDAEMWLRRLYRDYIQDIPWKPSKLAYLTDTLTSWDIEKGGDYSANAANTVEKLSEGWNFVLNTTHGSDNRFWVENKKYFSIWDALNINQLNAIYYTGSCNTGAFDRAEPSMSEAMLRNPQGGSLAYIGSSRYGWGYLDPPPASNYSYGGSSLDLMRNFFEILFKYNYGDIGQCFNAHKLVKAVSVPYNASIRWLFYSVNYQGDPALKKIISQDNANHPPVIVRVNPNPLIPKVSETQVIRVDAYDPDNLNTPLEYEWSKIDGPGEVEFSSKHSSETEVRYSLAGRYTIQIKVWDDMSFSTQDITITVKPDNEPPVVMNLSFKTNEDEAKNITLIGIDPEKDKLSYELIKKPTHGSLKGDAPYLTYVPHKDYYSKDNGDGGIEKDTFQYRVFDGYNYSKPAFVSIEVVPVNDLPVIEEILLDKNEIKAGESVKFTVTAYDVDNESISIDLIEINGLLESKKISKLAELDGKFYHTTELTFEKQGDYQYQCVVLDGGAEVKSDVFDIKVVESSQTFNVDFSQFKILPYGINQDINSSFYIDPKNQKMLTIIGNGWKKITLPENLMITEDTVLEFEYRTEKKGEIHGIGFDDNDHINFDLTFKLDGTQNWGMPYNTFTETDDGWRHYKIRLGDHYKKIGAFRYLFFVNDQDTSRPNAESQFRNIQIHSKVIDPRDPGDVVEISEKNLISYGIDQDKQSKINFDADHTGFSIIGNSWKKILLPKGIKVNPKTVLEFDYKCDSLGEIHGIGFDNNDHINSEFTFKLDGTQNWGVPYKNYTENDTGFKHYKIEIGKYYKTFSELKYLFFVNDHDVSKPTAKSTFKNIKVYDKA